MFRTVLRGSSLAGLFAIVVGFTLADTPENAPAPRPVGNSSPEAIALDFKILEDVKTKSEIMANLGYLSDVIGPRVTGSANAERANKWTEAKMKEYGLQNVRLEPWEIPVGWERGTAKMTMLEPNPGKTLLVASAAWRPGTKGKITGEVVYLEAKTKADLAKYKGKLKNAIVMRAPPSNVAPITDLNYGPGGGGGPKKDFAKKGDAKKDDVKKDDAKRDDVTKKDDAKKDDAPSATQLPRVPIAEMMALRREMDDFLRAEGAAVVLSDSNKPHGLLVTTGGWREGDRAAAQEPIPALFMAHEHYAMLHRLATRKDATPTKIELEITNTFVPGPITVFNTVGEIVGSEKPDEVIVVGAHLDSWDLGTGTTDNGTGSSIVLEVARTLAKMAKEGDKPKRTIRFVLFTGEEQGLYGSKRYVEKHKAEMDKHSVALVHDTGTGIVKGFGLQGREAARKVIEPELDSLKKIPGWVGLDLGNQGGTDHLSFESVGVPGFACRQDMDEYRLTHHTQSDTFDKAKEPNLIQGASVIAVTALRIANMPNLLPREKPAGGFGGRGQGKKDDVKKKDD